MRRREVTACHREGLRGRGQRTLGGRSGYRWVWGAGLFQEAVLGCRHWLARRFSAASATICSMGLLRVAAVLAPASHSRMARLAERGKPSQLRRAWGVAVERGCQIGGFVQVFNLVHGGICARAELHE